ncbi:sporulation protein YtxC [Alkalibacillus aidingensis]|uniref:sporulation protein YtxC n=1 Tax=Alkalibacillus aidingensis TaxID=2747607 RepID=UPI001660E9FC|nr:sporulation protein YtxC [Alkalibacillus aidingensis]
MKETSFLFRNDHEANQFNLYLITTEHGGIANIDSRTITLPNYQFNRTSLIDFIYPFILDVYVPRIAQKILQEAYYFDQREVEQIIPYVISLSTTPKILHSEFKHSLYERLVQFIYHLEDLTEINMNEIYQQLFLLEDDWFEIVGYGIEEWKEEMLFQDRMHQLRTYIEDQEPFFSHVIVYYRNHPILFRQNGQIIQDHIISSASIPFQEQMDQSKVISKLLAIAPEKVDVYASNGKVHEIYSLMNIFQERIRLYPIEQFPFQSKLKRAND